MRRNIIRIGANMSELIEEHRKRLAKGRMTYPSICETSEDLALRVRATLYNKNVKKK